MKTGVWILYVWVLCVSMEALGGEEPEVFRKFGRPKGATLLYSRHGLKLPLSVNRFQLDKAEAENASRAHAQLFRRRCFPTHWFNEPFLLGIHNLMFGDVWEWAGVLYSGPARNIGVDSGQISERLTALCGEVNDWLAKGSRLTFVEQSARILHEIARVHPFTNGNGRYARLVADLYLYSVGGEPPVWLHEALLVDGQERTDLMYALEMADAGFYQPLESLMVRKGARNPSIAQAVESPYIRRWLSRDKRVDLINAVLAFDSRVGQGVLPVEMSPRLLQAKISIVLIVNSL